MHHAKTLDLLDSWHGGRRALGAMWITDWTARAACKGTDPDELFVEGAAQNRAKLICRGCPVRTECLADALDNGIEFGVWGGMTERERRALLRRRPDVISWRDLLEHAEHVRDDEIPTLRAAIHAMNSSPRAPWPAVERVVVAQLLQLRTAGSSATSVDHDQRDLNTSAETAEADGSRGQAVLRNWL